MRSVMAVIRASLPSGASGSAIIRGGLGLENVNVAESILQDGGHTMPTTRCGRPAVSAAVAPAGWRSDSTRQSRSHSSCSQSCKNNPFWKKLTCFTRSQTVCLILRTGARARHAGPRVVGLWHQVAPESNVQYMVHGIHTS